MNGFVGIYADVCQWAHNLYSAVRFSLDFLRLPSDEYADVTTSLEALMSAMPEMQIRGAEQASEPGSIDFDAAVDEFLEELTSAGTTPPPPSPPTAPTRGSLADSWWINGGVCRNWRKSRGSRSSSSGLSALREEYRLYLFCKSEVYAEFTVGVESGGRIRRELRHDSSKCQ